MPPLEKHHGKSRFDRIFDALLTGVPIVAVALFLAGAIQTWLQLPGWVMIVVLVVAVLHIASLTLVSALYILGGAYHLIVRALRKPQ